MQSFVFQFWPEKYFIFTRFGGSLQNWTHTKHTSSGAGFVKICPTKKTSVREGGKHERVQ